MTKIAPTIQEAIDALLDPSQDVDRELLLHYTSVFSDMLPAHRRILLETWDEISLARRHALLAHLKNELETDLLYSFELLARALLLNDDPITRTYAIRLLVDCENDNLVAPLLDIATQDPAMDARAEAITSLGAYVYYGEIEEISQDNLSKVEEALLEIAQNSEKAELKMRAVESLGFSSRKEVPQLIQSAWARGTAAWMANALSAMGRSVDKVWEDEILEGLLHESELVRLAAAKAAGELSLPLARPILLNFLKEEKDEAVLRVAIWSLSEIGGEDVREYLLALLDEYEDDDQAEIEYMEEALANLDFTEDVQSLDLFDFDSPNLLEGEE